jgi:hypothetical protein
LIENKEDSPKNPLTLLQIMMAPIAIHIVRSQSEKTEISEYTKHHVGQLFPMKAVIFQRIVLPT